MLKRNLVVHSFDSTYVSCRRHQESQIWAEFRTDGGRFSLAGRYNRDFGISRS